MKTIAVALLFFIAMTTQAKPGAIVIHAGAGSLNRDSFTSERKRLYHATLEQSLHAGNAILNIGGNTIDAVKAAIVIMEDATVFNPRQWRSLHCRGQKRTRRLDHERRLAASRRGRARNHGEEHHSVLHQTAPVERNGHIKPVLIRYPPQ